MRNINTDLVWDTVRDICGDSWRNASKEEVDGALGVAMTMVYLLGVPSELYKFSEILDVPQERLKEPFRRLKINGVLRRRSSIIKDPLLKGYKTKYQDDEDCRKSWCWIAGMASGFVGIAN